MKAYYLIYTHIILFAESMNFVHIVISSSFAYMNRSACWPELWLSKVFQKSRVICLIDVVRRFEFGAVMQDVVCSLHLATFAQIWAAQFHVGRKSVNTSPQAVELNPGIYGEFAAWWLWAECVNEGWRTAGIGVVGSPLIDNNSTKERRDFLEWRRFGEGFRYRVSWRRCFGSRALV